MKYALSPTSLTRDRAPPSPPQNRARGRPGDACGRRAWPPRRACPGGARAGEGGSAGARGAPTGVRRGEPRPARLRRVDPGARAAARGARLAEAPGASRARASRAPNSGGGGTIGAHEGASPPSPGRRRGSEAGRWAGAARRGPPDCRLPTWLALRPRRLLRLSSRSGSSARTGARAAPRESPRESPGGGGERQGPPRVPRALGPRLRGRRVVPAPGRGRGGGAGAREAGLARRGPGREGRGGLRGGGA